MASAKNANAAEKVNVTPLHDRVIVKPAKAEEKTAGGIIIPDTAKMSLSLMISRSSPSI